jgi:8-oxo-dGTP pyrophosphatase MutT (NUDIX family)
MKWRLLKSEYLFKDLWFTVRKDTCKRTDGAIINPYYVYEFPEWVTAIAITVEGKFIFERQYRHALGLTLMELPGGCVDPTDESLQGAVSRELKEETGYEFSSYTYLGKTSSNPSTNNNWMHFFLAQGGTKIAEQMLDHNEEIELHFLSLSEVKQLLKEKEIIQSMHATALFYALDYLGELHY